MKKTDSFHCSMKGERTERKYFSVVNTSVVVIFFSLILMFNIFLTEIRAENFINAAENVTVDEAVSIALANNHDYKLAMSRLQQADEKVKSVWGQLVPVFESEASLTRQGAENGFMSLSDGQYDIKLVQMKLAVNPGIFYNSLELSRNSLVAAREDVRKIKSEIEYQVIKNYFGILMAVEMVNLRKESISVLKQNLKDVENQYRTGSVPRLELLQAQVQLKNQEPMLLDSENAYQAALDMFNFTLGSDKNSYSADGTILSETVLTVDDNELDENIDLLTELAMKNRPEIIQLERRRDMAMNSEKMNASYYLWPTFSLTGYYGYTKLMPNEIDLGLSGPVSPDFSQVSGNDEWQNTWQIRAAATYRWGALLPVEKSQADRKESEEKVKEISEEILKLRQLISISIKSSYLKLRASCLTIQSQKGNVSLAEESLRIARESYRAGLIRNSDLLNADLSLTTAKTGYINAVNSYYTAVAELKKETGADIISLLKEGGTK